jgi:hypothetical protein
MMAFFRRFDDPESQRLVKEAAREGDWKRWGTYLPERQWGTVREDYSIDGDSWRSFSHEAAAARIFRWGEDGLLGWSDRKCRLGFSVALWNGRDPILKERLFGLTNPEGNHGEDVKELYYYLGATPTHSYCRALYKYPLDAFPYRVLRDENQNRGYHDPEFELTDTGVIVNGHYVDVLVEYAKAGPNDSLARIRVINRSSAPAQLFLLGQLVFRNTWVWGCEHEGCTPRPVMEWDTRAGLVRLRHSTLGRFAFVAAPTDTSSDPEWLFTENESNLRALFEVPNRTPYTKDAFHRYLVEGERDAVNPSRQGTKCAALYRLNLGPRGEREFRFRLFEDQDGLEDPLGRPFKRTFTTRIQEMERFYEQHFPNITDPEEKRVHRQAMAGLLWSKQFYHYSVYDWLKGDPGVIAPPPGRGLIRNGDWEHLFARDILSMPDKWEYPWLLPGTPPST